MTDAGTFPGPSTFPGRGSGLSAIQRTATPLQAATTAIAAATISPVTVTSLGLASVAMIHATLPSAALYPGSTSFPGRGADLSGVLPILPTLAVTPV